MIFLEDVLEKKVAKQFFINREILNIKNQLLNNPHLFEEKKFLRPIRVGTISKGGKEKGYIAPKDMPLPYQHMVAV